MHKIQRIAMHTIKNAKCFTEPRKCQTWPSDQKNLPTKVFFQTKNISRPNFSFRPKFSYQKYVRPNSFSNHPNWL